MTPRQLWTWFDAQRARLRWPVPRELLEEIGERLHEIHAGLGFELVKADPPVLAISACGDAALFGLVREIVRCAPTFPFVRVVAFRQRGPVAGFAVRCSEGGTLSDDDIWFRLTVADGGVGLFVFVRDYPAEKPGHIQEDVYLLLDNALGEEDVVSIDWIEWAPLPVDPAVADLSPLAGLPEQFDRAVGRRPLA